MLKKESKPIKVLLIDGEYREAYPIHEAMTENGSGAFDLEYTDRLSAGLERLTRGGIDVLLLAPSVSDSHELDSLARRRAQSVGVPVVTLSSLDEETSEIEVLKKGSKEYLAKRKAYGDQLARTINHALTRQRLTPGKKRQSRWSESGETRLHNILRGIPDGIIIVDRRGIVRFVNPAVESLFNCKAEQLLGESLNFVPMVEGGKTELGIVRENGEKGTAEIRVVETKYRGERAYLASLRDITQRKQAEAEMRSAMGAAEARVKSVEEAAEATKAASDEAVATAEESARLAWEETEAIKASSQEAIARAEEQARLAREEVEAAKTASQEAIAGAEEQVRLAKEEAEAANLASQVAIARAEEQARLITEEATAAKKAAQEAISKAEEQVKLAREETMTAHLASEEAVARAEKEARLAREEIKAIKTASQEAIDKAKEEVRAIKAASQEAIAKAEKEAETGKTAADDTITRLERELHDVDPIQSELMANIVHELRAPLHSIIGFTRLVLDGGAPDPETQQEFLNIIADQSEHLRRLIDELVDISPVKSGHIIEVQKERVSMKDLLQNAVNEVYSVANQRKIALDQNIPESLPKMEVDGQRLRQVMFNLLSNAIKFIDEGGSISVRAEVNDNNLLVQVADKGPGIAEDTMPFIFEKYYKGKNTASTRGLGLGLYISKQIIEAHGGQIWAESAEGVGSTFSFTIPLKPPDR